MDEDRFSRTVRGVFRFFRISLRPIPRKLKYTHEITGHRSDHEGSKSEWLPSHPVGFIASAIRPPRSCLSFTLPSLQLHRADQPYASSPLPSQPHPLSASTAWLRPRSLPVQFVWFEPIYGIYFDLPALRSSIWNLRSLWSDRPWLAIVLVSIHGLPCRTELLVERF